MPLRIPQRYPRIVWTARAKRPYRRPTIGQLGPAGIRRAARAFLWVLDHLKAGGWCGPWSAYGPIVSGPTDSK